MTVAASWAFGVLLAGLPRLGAGRDWIPTAALLVLLVGGKQPGRFLLWLPDADGRGRRGRHRGQLAGVSAAALQRRGPQPGRTAAGLGQAAAPTWGRPCRKSGRPNTRTGRAVRRSWRRQPAPSGQPSRRRMPAGEANPRRRLHPRDVDRDYHNLRDLERVTFHIQDMTEVLADVIWSEDTPFTIPAARQRTACGGLDAVGRSAAFFGGGRRRPAGGAVPGSRSGRRRPRWTAPPPNGDGAGTPSAAESILLSLHRILRVANPTGK